MELNLLERKLFIYVGETTERVTTKRGIRILTLGIDYAILVWSVYTDES